MQRRNSQSVKVCYVSGGKQSFSEEKKRNDTTRESGR